MTVFALRICSWTERGGFRVYTTPRRFHPPTASYGDPRWDSFRSGITSGAGGSIFVASGDETPANALVISRICIFFFLRPSGPSVALAAANPPDVYQRGS
jgi:hypothetical protein